MGDSLDHARLAVVLVSTRNSLNIGAAARAMCNFGFDRLRVVHPYEPAFREARSAVGAARILADAQEFSTVAEAVSDCTLVVGTVAVGRRTPQHPWHSLADGAALVREVLRATGGGDGRVAILFGSEKFGLSNQDLSHCHAILHIPTGEEQPSMNLGQAVAVCLYELVRENAAAPLPETSLAASSGVLERTTVALLEALHASGYMAAEAGDFKELSVRRLVRRLHLSAEDASLWLGMLRQILWKLQSRS